MEFCSIYAINKLSVLSRILYIVIILKRSAINFVQKLVRCAYIKKTDMGLQRTQFLFCDGNLFLVEFRLIYAINNFLPCVCRIYALLLKRSAIKILYNVIGVSKANLLV